MIHNQTFSYIDLGTIKNAGNLNITSTDYDDLLLMWAEIASRFVNEYCNRYFYCYEGIKYFDGTGQTLHFNDDVLSVTTLQLDPSGTKAYDVTMATTDYEKYPPNRFPVQYLKTANNASVSSFATNIRAGVKLTGVFGYGNGDSATPYTDSGITATVATTIGTVLTLSNTATGTATNGSGTMTGSPVTLNAGANTPTVTGAGTFVVNIPVNATGTATSGGWTVTGSPVALTSGSNTITVQAGGSGTITITLTNNSVIQPGHTVRIESEQMYVTAINATNSTATVMRGANGTTAATHSAKSAYVYQYHPSVVGATIIQLSIWWKRRESAFAARVGNAISGEYEIYRGLDEGVGIMLSTGGLVRRTF
jgi:hypothetical protein